MEKSGLHFRAPLDDRQLQSRRSACLKSPVLPRPVWLSLAVTLSLLLHASPSTCQETHPLVPQLDPAQAAEMIVQFHDALAAGLRAGGLRSVEPATVRARLKLGIENAGCFAGPCLQVAQGLLGTGRLAAAQVRAVGKTYTIEVRLYADGEVLASATGRCDICTVAEAMEAVTRVASDVGSQGEEPPPPRSIAPAGRPSSGGKTLAPLHTAPPDGAAAEGTPAGRGAAGTPTASAVSLVHGSSAGDATEGSRGRKSRAPMPLWPGIVAGGAGAIGLAIGMPLIAIDGQPTACRGEPRPDTSNCAEIYQTAAGGWVLTSLGAAALGTAGILTYLHLSARPKERRQVWLDRLAVVPSTDGGLLLGAGGRF